MHDGSIDHGSLINYWIGGGRCPCSCGPHNKCSASVCKAATWNERLGSPLLTSPPSSSRMAVLKLVAVPSPASFLFYFAGSCLFFFVLPAVDMPKDRSCLSASLSTDYWRMCKARHEIADRPSFSLMSFNFSFFLLPLYGPSVYGPHEPKINITYILGVFFGGKLPRPEHERICQAKKLNLSHVFSTQQTWEPSSLPVLRSSTWRAWMNFRPCLDSKS